MVHFRFADAQRRAAGLGAVLAAGCAADGSAAPAGSAPAASAGADAAPATVYFTRDISPAGLQAAFDALGAQPAGNVAVKLSTGEPGGHNFLAPELIGDFVRGLGATIVECNTAYGAARSQRGPTQRGEQPCFRFREEPFWPAAPWRSPRSCRAARTPSASR